MMVDFGYGFLDMTPKEKGKQNLNFTKIKNLCECKDIIKKV